MTSDTSPKEYEKSQTNGHATCPSESKNIEQKPASKGKDLRLRKVYAQRNSYLTDLMSVTHLQTVYNISVAIFNLLLLTLVLFYAATPQTFWKDVSSLRWATRGAVFCVQAWLCLNLWAFAVFRTFKLWLRARNAVHAKVADTIFLALYILSIGLLFTAIPYSILKVSLPPITGFAIVAEQIRIFMKVYSFVRENVPRVLQYKAAKDGKQEHQLCPPFKHFIYFMFAPTLLYRDSYPRTQSVSGDFLLRKTFKFLACIFIQYCIFTRFVVEVFRLTGIRSFSLAEVSLVYGGCIFTGSMIMFCGFYGVLHGWLNLFAEAMKFADREFYQDWWNSTSFSQYYRRWNGVVHDWLYAYIYVDTYKLGLNRSASLILVFVISAIVHEYWVAFSLGFFYPVLMITYTTIGIIVLFLTKQRTANFWNTFMWTMLFSGWGLIVMLYSFEWFARINCPSTLDPITDFFMPRSWSTSCKILDISL